MLLSHNPTRRKRAHSSPGRVAARAVGRARVKAGLDLPMNYFLLLPEIPGFFITFLGRFAISSRGQGSDSVGSVPLCPPEGRTSGHVLRARRPRIRHRPDSLTWASLETRNRMKLVVETLDGTQAPASRLPRRLPLLPRPCVHSAHGVLAAPSRATAPHPLTLHCSGSQGRQ